MTFLIVLLALLLMADPAHAGPVIGVFAAIGAAIKGSFILTFLARIVVSVALSRLAVALAPKPRQPGIRTDGAAGGSQNPAGFILGRYATDGVAVCPPMSHGRNNNMLTLVVELGDIPRQQLSRVLVNDEWVTLGTVPSPDGYGLPATGKFADFVWVKFYDGTQTAADPMLVEKYGAYPERPWSADMIGTGICYAIVTVKFKRSLFNSIPRVRFELTGIPLYDPRKDSTVGGSGPHRWENPATWEPSRNPMVQVYNIHRGISLPGGYVWGFRNAASALPLDSVFAAANACDVAVPAIGGGTEPAFVSDYEVYCSDEPMSICEEIFKACMGQAAEVGGVWRFRVGAPALPLLSVTDDDVIVTQGQTFAPFKGLAQTFNGVHAAHPLPEALYQAVDAPPLYNAQWEAEDGGRRLIADLQLPTVTGSAQVQRLMHAYIREERRQRRHSATLPPDFAALEPFDVLSVTMAQHGYSGKPFEVDQVAHDIRTGLVQVSLVERDPADYVPPAVLFAPSVPSAVTVLGELAVAGFSAEAFSLADASGAARRPAVRLSWDGEAMGSARGLAFEVRVAATGQIAAQGSVQRVEDGEVIVGGLLPSTSYQARARAVSDNATVWTDWLSVATGAVQFISSDLAPGAVSFSDVRIDQDPLPAPWVLTPSDPAAAVGSAAAGTSFPVLLGGFVAELSVNLAAAVPRALHVTVTASGAPKGQPVLSQVVWLVPGASYQVLSQPTPLLASSSLGSTTLSVTALGLGSGETITVTGVRVIRQAMRV